MVERFAIIPTRDRQPWVAALVGSLIAQGVTVVVLDNGSDPPVEAEPGVEVIYDAEQPPNISRFWNLCFDRCEKLATASEWDVAVLNDDTLLPAGWYDIVATALRVHPTAVAAHTGAGPRIRTLALLTELDTDIRTRLCPHAFVIRGEAGLRADESLRWWFGDSDLDWQCRQAGGVLNVPGPRATNALANSTTVGGLQAQAEADEAAFKAKWSR